jgi:hypothetical protein
VTIRRRPRREKRSVIFDHRREYKRVAAQNAHGWAANRRLAADCEELLDAAGDFFAVSFQREVTCIE